MRIWWRKPPTKLPDADAQQLTDAPAHSRPPKDWPVAIPTTARRLASIYPNMFPEDSSAAAFVHWRQSLGSTGEIEQDALYDEYKVICEIADYQPLPLKKFGRELEMAGCRRKQADYRKRGKGRRPKVVTVPSVPMRGVRLPTSDRSVPWPELPMRKAA
jgi:hypothetical protein